MIYIPYTLLVIGLFFMLFGFSKMLYITYKFEKGELKS